MSLFQLLPKEEALARCKAGKQSAEYRQKGVFTKGFVCKWCGKGVTKSGLSVYSIQAQTVCRECVQTKYMCPSLKGNHIPDDFVHDLTAFVDDLQHWHEEASNGNIKVWSRVLPSTTVKAYRYEVDMKATPFQLETLLHDKLIELHKKWNETFIDEEAAMIEEDGLDNNIQKWVFSSPLASNRLFVCARRRVKDDKGVTTLYERSVGRDDVNARMFKNQIEAHLNFNFRRLTPLNGGTKFVYANMTALGGSFPIWLCNALNAKVSCEELRNVEQVAQTL